VVQRIWFVVLGLCFGPVSSLWRARRHAVAVSTHGVCPRHRSAGRLWYRRSVIGGRWKPVLVCHRLGGRKWFGELGRLTPSTSERMITLQLRALDLSGLWTVTIRKALEFRASYTGGPSARHWATSDRRGASDRDDRRSRASCPLPATPPTAARISATRCKLAR